MRISTEQFIERAVAIHGNKYDYSKSVYSSATTPVVIICSEHGEFQQQPTRHTRGQGCKGCQYDRKRLGKGAFIEKSRKVHGSQYDYRFVSYQSNSRKIRIGCYQCGSVFEQKPTHHLEGRGCNCKTRMDHKEFLRKAAETHGSKYSYGHYVTSTQKIAITCGECNHCFLQEPRTHLSGHGCPECAKTVIGLKRFLDEANDLHDGRYDYSLVTQLGTLSDELTIICPSHGEFKQKARKHREGSGCPACSASCGERDMAKALNAAGVAFQPQWEIDDGHGKLLADFFIENQRTVIEIDGKQHYEPIEFFGGKRTFAGVAERDLRKTRWCLENGYRIIRIGYHELHRIKEVAAELAIYGTEVTRG